MKQTILFICLCLLLFSGCRTPQKITNRLAESVTGNERQNEATSSETYNFADTTKKSDVEVNYFKIEFYPPAGPEDKADMIPDNSTLPEALSSNTGSKNPSKPPDNKGAIKSIEGYTVKAKSEQSGVNESKENTQVNRNAEKSEDINRQAETVEQPAPDPYRWRYILGIVIVVILATVGVYFGFRKSKIVVSIISFLKNLF
ncbi:MAG: OPT/YSL family transporter [Bacteroidales bacterium]|jgi:cobalamin biosynthesis Mg chelatase CobN|nr:OPT/YSL family transporter [Bacteroidales bacterium]